MGVRGVVVGVLLALGLPLVPASAQAAPVPAGTAAATVPGAVRPRQEAAPPSPETVAAAAARKAGARVEVGARRTASAQVFANPDGTFTLEQSVRPLRDQSGAAAHWTMINRSHPDQSYWSYDRNDGAKSGYVEDNGIQLYRSMWDLPIGYLHGKHVLGATFSLDLIHSWSCADSRTDLYLVGTIGPNTDWNNHQGTWSSGNYLATATNSSCQDVRKRSEWANHLAGRLQGAANARWPMLTVGVRAADESDHDGWKKFDPNSGRLAVRFNSFPNVPDSLTTRTSPTFAKPCVKGGQRPYFPFKTPILSARVSDPDGGQLTAMYEWAQVLPGGSYGPVAKANVTNVASGAFSQYRMPDVVDGNTYAWHVRASDGTDASGFSGWCEFTVDATPPDVPTAVTSPEYPADGEFHGGAGRTGMFSFTPPAMHPEDVVAYLYGLNQHNQPTGASEVPVTTPDRKVTVPITPNWDGSNTLYVWARDKAGNVSDPLHPLTYQFAARSASSPGGHWKLDEDGTDASGHSQDLIRGGASGWAPGRPGNGAALRLDDTGSGFARTAGPVVPTDQSFTASAWVRLNKAGKTATVLSQDGTRTGAFALGYSAAENKWSFRLRGADSDSPPVAGVVSAKIAQLGVWTHLVGAYDAGSRQINLFVNGRVEKPVTVPFTPWNAGGPLNVGRGTWAGVATDYWPGDIDDVRVWDRVVFDPEASALAEVPVLIGAWNLDEGEGAAAMDSAGVKPDHTGTLTPGVSWSEVNPDDATPDGNGSLGRPDQEQVATFNGTTGRVTTKTPILRTDQSLTVAAWARLTDTTSNRTVIAQEGAHTSAFFLQYDATTKRWAMGGSSADVNGAGLVRATSTSTPQVGKWTHLVGVYDASDQRLRLYVDGVLEGNAEYRTAWQANGPLSIGEASYNSNLVTFWKGDLATVKTYSGVVSDNDIRTLAGR